MMNGFNGGEIFTFKQDKKLLVESLPVCAVHTLMQAALVRLQMADM